MTDLADVGLSEKPRSKLRDGFTRLCRNRAALFSMVVVPLIVLACIFGPYFVPFDPNEADFDAISVPPLTGAHLFGTDDLGRDLLARILVAGRTSLLIALLASSVAIVIGITYGSIAGFFGGIVDLVMMRLVDVLYGLPFLFFVIMLTMIFGRGLSAIFIAIGAVLWLEVGVITRGQTLSLKQKEFIEAARAGGMRPLRIIRKHIVPNVLGAVIVYASLLVPLVILGESFLSYLGLGVQEPETSWGVLISDGASAMDNAPWQLIFPVLFLVVTLFSLNFLADGLRDAFDPKDR